MEYVPASKAFIEEMQGRREREDWVQGMLKSVFHVPKDYRATPKQVDQVRAVHGKTEVAA